MPMFADSVRGLSAAMIIAAITIAALVLGRDVLMPFALSIVLAFMLAPLARFLSARRVPHGAAVWVVMLALVAFVGLASAVFSSQLLTLTASLAGYKDNLAQKVRVITGSSSGDGAIRKAADSIEVIEKVITREAGAKPAEPPAAAPVVVAREAKSAAASLFEQVRSLAGPLAGIGLTLLFTAFLLAQHLDIRDRVVRLAGVDNMTATTSALSEAGARLSRLFMLQAALNGGFGLVVGVALALIGVPNAVLWGLATACLRFVPFIGSFLAAIPPILLAGAVDPGWGMMLATIALFAIGEPLVGHVVEPYVLGRGLGLSAFAMVAAASFWTLVWGPVGLLLAAPLTMALVVLGQYMPRLEFLSVLLGDAPALAPQEEFYHRLLSSDAAAGAEQVEAAAAGSLAAAADRVVLPALRIAARDHRNERLDTDQAAAVGATLDDVAEIVADGLPQADDAAAGEAAVVPVIVIPARGTIDVAAARYVAATLGRATGQPCLAVTQASGLMAVAAARGIAGGAARAIVLSTVGGMDHQHLRLLIRRIRREFPDVRLVVGDWGLDEPRFDEAEGELLSTRLAEVAKHLEMLPAGAAAETSRRSEQVPDRAATIGNLGLQPLSA